MQDFQNIRSYATDTECLDASYHIRSFVSVEPLRDSASHLRIGRPKPVGGPSWSSVSRVSAVLVAPVLFDTRNHGEEKMVYTSHWHVDLSCRHSCTLVSDRPNPFAFRED